MQLVTISVDGHAQEVQLALRVDPQLVSNKDWLLRAELFHQGSTVSSDDVGWGYSATLDANFVYLITARGESAFLPRPLVCAVPFDEVRLSLLPWSASAKESQASPEVYKCRYAVRSQRLDGENIQMETHVLGDLDLELMS